MNNPKVYWGVKIAFFVLLFFGVVSYLVMVLWNWLIPDLFNGPYINFWKAAGLLLLSKILFSGFGKKMDKGHYKHSWKNHFVHKHELTPEQKQELKEKFVSKWCRSYPSHDEPETSEKKEQQA